MYIYPHTTSSLSIHPLTGIGCFYVLFIATNVAMNMEVQIFLWDNDFISFDIYPEVGLLDRVVVLLLFFCGSSVFYFLTFMTAPIYTPTNSAQRFPFLHILTNTCYCLSFFFLITTICWYTVPYRLGFPGGSDGKVSACNAGDLGSIPELGRSLGEGKGYPLQYSGLENSMAYTVAKNRTRLSDFHFLKQTVRK